MGISVLTEPVNSGGFRAVSGPPFDAEAMGESREAATNRLMEIIAERIQQGARVDTVDVPPPDAHGSHPLARFVGDMQNDPLFESWQEAIRSFREEREKDDLG
jgi:hypothetical protein